MLKTKDILDLAYSHFLSEPFNTTITAGALIVALTCADQIKKIADEEGSLLNNLKQSYDNFFVS